MSAGQSKYASVTARLLFAAALGGCFFRLLYPFLDNPLDHLFSDPKRHWDNARHFFSPSLMNGCDPILYQVYLLAVQTITGFNAIGVALATGVLSAVMPWTFYRAARALGIARTSSLLFWVLMAWLPSFLNIYRYFMIETLLLPLIGLGLWMTGRALRKQTFRAFLLMTFVWCLASLTKPQAIPLAMACWAYVLYRIDSRIKPALASVALVLLLALPNAFRTHQILGYAAPFGTGYIAQIMHRGGAMHTRFHWKGGIWIYSSPSCYIYPLEPLSYWRMERGVWPRSKEVWIRRETGKSDWQDALNAVDWSWSERMNSLMENLILFFHAPSWPDSGKDTWLGSMNYWLRWIWPPLIFLVLAGNISFFMEKHIHLIPLATTGMLLILLFQNSVTMEGRYRKPVEPLILLNLIWLAGLYAGRDRDCPLSGGNKPDGDEAKSAKLTTEALRAGKYRSGILLSPIFP